VNADPDFKQLSEPQVDFRGQCRLEAPSGSQFPHERWFGGDHFDPGSVAVPVGGRPDQPQHDGRGLGCRFIAEHDRRRKLMRNHQIEAPVSIEVSRGGAAPQMPSRL